MTARRRSGLSGVPGMMRTDDARETTGMTAPGALTEQDVVAVRESAAAGKPVTVWFTEAAVGVPAGRSAKVSAVGDASEGDFIQVKPAGSRDTMFCSPNELTLTRPARRSATAPAATGKAASAEAATGKAATGKATAVAAAAGPGPATRAAAPDGAPVRPAAARGATPGAGASTPRPAAGSGPTTSTAAMPTAGAPTAGAPTSTAVTVGAATAGAATSSERSGPAGSAPAASGRAVSAADLARAGTPVPTTRPARGRAARPSGMTVTLEATPEGEWSVEVRVGTKRVVPAVPVPAADLATAARSLPTAVAEAIESSLEGARQRQRDRVEQLRSELDAAQRVLDQLDV